MKIGPQLFPKRNFSILEGNSVEFGFDHVHFLVSDVRALTEYFERVFEMETLEFLDDHKGAAYSIFQLGSGTLRIRGMREDDV
ncbi:MAG: hypothetical protein HOG04_09780, partial [Nitrospinaceae bacterium]|nr:hypothetical protein [Nitrospinaceae bacterium]